MTEKLTVRVTSWKPLHRNTLRGFAAVKVEELRLSFFEVAVHSRDGRSWAQLPSRPWVKDGAVVTDDSGKIRYQPLHEFDSPAVRAAFSDAVVRAVLAYDPDVLADTETAA
jgi:hypothetical protein